MENTTSSVTNQVEEKIITHIRVPIYLKKRLDKIRKNTGKMADSVNKEILQLGIEEYYKRLKKVI